MLRRDPLLRAYLGWTALACVLFLVLDGNTSGQVRAFWAFQPPLDLALAICSWRVARLVTGPIRRFWRVMATVGALFTIGDTWQAVSTWFPGDWSSTGGTVQTVCFGVGLTAVVTAMLLHPQPGRTGRERLAFWLDSATVLVAGGVVGWCVLAVPGEYSRPDVLAMLAATGVCITAAFSAVKMILSGNAPMHRLAAVPMVGSAVVMSAGAFLAPDSYLVRFLPTLLIAVGPRIQQILADADRTAFGERRKKPYSLLPYGAMVVAFGALVFALSGGVGARLWGVVAGLALICGLVAVRQLVAFHDNVELMKRLHRQAHFDGLTGLANRTHFHEQLAAALPASPALSVLLVDLDGFKSVNDTMGHAAGDALLLAVADKLRAQIRTADLPARLGGDEFAVLLPNCTAEEAEATAARILDALTIPVVIEGVPVTAAASIGVAAASPASDATSLLRDADLAMYAAKHQGKGTWQRHDNTMTYATR
ncbi:GGDEF domain-containing protein [Paractinoplanes atraurantiacus]|uniref:Diguanylate cyclase (GGDEF) domain-containing protein n=1 Tax=Paractinoplanes atraurantiacus TaxID=1036182 RepID=A0A285K1K5_9ACTN|nr:GGDEF domain-containing protein [Actinoplanes atraurantiacus]SNY66460.1 diguanylate cyclase (GGDEF) domain-containing protein [Actinoplanes atraurantiacus]